MDAPKDCKRKKREIANSNERRRMQSINEGFKKLRRLLPINENEKLSKANILQHAAQFIELIGSNQLNATTTTTISTNINNNNNSTIINNNNNDNITNNDTNNISTSNNNNNNNNNLITNISNTNNNSTTFINNTVISNVNSSNIMSNNCVAKNEIISDRTTDPKVLTPGVGKAAIALPIEAPYIANQSNLETIPLAASMLDAQDNVPKGQNRLETLCTAIRRIEGDHTLSSK